MNTNKARKLASINSHWPVDLFRMSAETTLSACLSHLKSENVAVVHKGGDALWPTAATVTPVNLVLLPELISWESRTIASKAELLIHEISHLRDRDAVGRAKWSIRYLRPIWTIITEARAYACGYALRIYLAKGEVTRNKARLRKWAEKEASKRFESVYKRYIPIKILLSKEKAKAVFVGGFVDAVEGFYSFE